MGYTTFTNGTQPAVNDTILNNMQVELMKLVFPIGSTYVTQTDTNPSTILGFGTWERVKGKVLVGLDEDDTAFNTIGKTGGENTHTLTEVEMPAHNHSISYPNEGGPDTSALGQVAMASTKNTWGAEMCTTQNRGGSQPHNNLQPYQVVGYMWRRTA